MAPRKMLKMTQRKKSEPMRRSSALSDVHFRSTCAALAAAQPHTKVKYCKTNENRDSVRYYERSFIFIIFIDLVYMYYM